MLRVYGPGHGSHPLPLAAENAEAMEDGKASGAAAKMARNGKNRR